jgi:hypothetical protein
MYKYIFVGVGLLLFSQGVNSQEAPGIDYMINASGGFYTGYHQTISISRAQEAGRQFWVAERRYRTTQGPSGPTIVLKHQWIDGRLCPQLASVVSAIDALPRPPSDNPKPPFHGFRVNVSPSKNGEGARRHDYEGPVTTWWRTADDRLASCWQEKAVVVDGAALSPSLDSDQAERSLTPLPSQW